MRVSSMMEDCSVMLLAFGLYGFINSASQQKLTSELNTSFKYLHRVNRASFAEVGWSVYRVTRCSSESVARLHPSIHPSIRLSVLFFPTRTPWGGKKSRLPARATSRTESRALICAPSASTQLEPILEQHERNVISAEGRDEPEYGYVKK